MNTFMINLPRIVCINSNEYKNRKIRLIKSRMFTLIIYGTKAHRRNVTGLFIKLLSMRLGYRKAGYQMLTARIMI